MSKQSEQNENGKETRLRIRMSWFMQVRTSSCGWEDVRSSNGKIYEFQTQDEALRELDNCYPHEPPGLTRVTSREVVR